MYDFSDLEFEIQDLRGRASTKSASWDRLLEVTHALANGQPGAKDDDLLTKHRWALTRVSIAGFRGVSNEQPLVLDIDPRPGVTVLHGANGAGKSSIADAVVAALTGQLESSQGVGGSTPLWDPVPLGRDAERAEVAISLVADARRLDLRYSTSRLQINPTWECTLTDGEKQIPVPLGEHWRVAVTNHQPVFAYASLERRVQLSRDLQAYFENLLALGGAFTRLDEEVKTRGMQAKTAYDAWKVSRAKAERQLAGVDTDQWSGTEENLPSVVLPQIGDGIDAWINDNLLSETAEALGELAADTHAVLVGAGAALEAAAAALSSAVVTIHQKLASPLRSIHAVAIAEDELDDVCPVCDAQDSHWVAHLSTTVAELKALDAFRLAAKTALAALRDASNGALDAILHLPVSEATPHLIALGIHNGTDKRSEFLEAVATHGCQPEPAVLPAAQRLSAWLAGSEASSLVTYAIMQADRLKQWRRLRSIAVEEFIGSWRVNKPVGVASPDWDECGKRVTDLKSCLRRKRTNALETLASQRVSELLVDVGLSIHNLDVKQRGATMQLSDPSGKPLELGMLSAGQRNAVLLAPLIAAAEGGPFGFLLFDDPVHAFDELRVDKLAQAIGRLAANRRVVVLTHDERLREQLLALSGEFDSYLVTRSPTDGIVEVVRSDELWDQLLNDAALLLKMNVQVANTTMTVTDAVRGLCRQSVDNALRSCIVRNAVRTLRDVARDLHELDTANTTDGRLQKALRLVGPATDLGDRLVAARSTIAPFADAWNRATHGNAPTTALHFAEIEAAREACLELVGG